MSKIKYHYVVGFAFQDKRVLLIRKEKPKWQRGYLNGVGGKIDDHETAIDAMVREFHEEVGVITSKINWREFCIVNGSDWVVHFFRVRFSSKIDVIQMEEEEPIWLYYEHLPPNVIDNLRWLIPMALAKNPVQATVNEV